MFVEPSNVSVDVPTTVRTFLMLPAPSDCAYMVNSSLPSICAEYASAVPAAALDVTGKSIHESLPAFVSKLIAPNSKFSIEVTPAP